MRISFFREFPLNLGLLKENENHEKSEVKTHLIVLYFTQSGNTQTCDTSKMLQLEENLTSDFKVKIPSITLVLVS